MIESLVQDEKGDIYLNSLRRYVQGGICVPSVGNSIVKVPPATAPGIPTASRPFTLEAPQDADSDIGQLVGVQGLSAVDTGTISSVGVAVTGVGTHFLSELIPGDSITETGGGQTRIVATIIDDTNLTTTVAFAPALAGVGFVNFTPVLADGSGRLFILMSDAVYRRPFMNTLFGAPVADVLGTAQKPTLMREKIWIERNGVIQCQLYNFSTTQPASMGILTDLRKWQTEALQYQEVQDLVDKERKRKPIYTPFWMTLDNLFVTVQPGGVNAGYMTGLGDATIVLWDITGHIIPAGPVGGDPEMALIEFADGLTGRTYQNAPIAFSCTVGTPFNPFRLSHPIIIRPRNQLKIRITSIATGNPIDAFVTLGGAAVYNAPNGGGILDPVILAEARRIWEATKPTYIVAGDHARN